MVRVLLVSLMVLTLWPSSARAAGHDGEVSLKGFVVARSEQTLSVRHGNGPVTPVLLSAATVIGGLRRSPGEITVNDVVRVEGVRAAGGGVAAHRVDVVLAAEGFRRAQPEYNSVFWNWVVNGSLSVPLP